MAIVVYPLNNIDFTAEDVAIYNSTRTSGIYAGDDFAISLTGSDNTISIDVGLAWMHLSRFNGVAVALKSKAFVDMGLPNATHPRIDALVLQFDANKNGAELVSKQGTASSNPQPPAVSRTEALYELHLLHVLRSPGAPSITAADVTDLRLNEKYCGLMADSATRVDTVAINAQVTALIQKLRDDLQKVEAQDYYASKNYVDANKVDKANVVNNFATTKEGFVADARALKELNDLKLSIELLWENSSPASSMSAQDISIDTDGELYLVEFYSYSTSYVEFVVIKKGTICRIRFFGNASSSGVASELIVRDVTIVDGKMNVTDATMKGMGYTNVSTRNEYLRPFRIWAVKGEFA